MELAAPKKRINHYYIRVSKEKKPISLAFFKVQLLHVYPLSHQQGYALMLKIPETEYNYQQLKDLENSIVEQIAEKNKEWFKNDLARETIEQLFKSSMNHQEFLVYYSALRPPTSSNIPFFEEWIQEKKYTMPLPIKCKVVCDGVFIYPKKFHLRWILTDLQEYDEKVYDDAGFDYDHRLEIEAYWKTQWESIHKSISKQIQRYEKLQCELKETFDNIQETSSLKLWETKIEQFKQQLSMIRKDELYLD